MKVAEALMIMKKNLKVKKAYKEALKRKDMNGVMI